MPTSNSKYNPFDQSFNWQSITGEQKTVALNTDINLYTVRLDQAVRPPQGGTSYISATYVIGGAPLTEVSGTPTAAGQFKVDYGFNAETETGIASALVWFNAADDGLAIEFDYDGWGTPFTKESIEEIAIAAATGASGGKEIGELMFLPQVKSPSSIFPYLQAWEEQLTIDVLNWPQLQPSLSSYVGNIDGTTSFSIDSYADNGGGKTRLTLTTNAINQKLADSIFAQSVLKGEGTSSFTGFIHPVEFTAITGSIPIGIYEVIGCDPTGPLTIDIDLNYPGSTAAGSFQLRPFADPADSNNARWPGLAGLTIRAPGSAFEFGELFAHIDQMQSHFHDDDSHAHSFDRAIISGAFGLVDFEVVPVQLNAGSTTGSANVTIRGPTTDTDDGTGTPRTGSETRDRSRIIPVYIFGGTYTP